jgi:vesicle-fusing ATPase
LSQFELSHVDFCFLLFSPHKNGHGEGDYLLAVHRLLFCITMTVAIYLFLWWLILIHVGFGWILSTVPVRTPKTPETAIATTNTKTIEKDLSAFEILARNVALCLIASDIKRDSGFDGSSTGWTSWVEEASASRLQKCIDKLQLASFENYSTNTTISFRGMTTERDDLLRWLKWTKASPAPIIVELSEKLRTTIDATIGLADLERVDQSSEAFLSRIACRLILLPSGGSLAKNLRTMAGAMVYGKLLYGGVTRYRVIGNTGNGQQMRRVGERTLIAQQRVPTESWLQYGGPERNYDAVDMGPCAIMELTILPKGFDLPLLYEPIENSYNNILNEMTIAQMQWNPDEFFSFPKEEEEESVADVDIKNEASLDGELLESDDLSSLLVTDGEYIEGLESTFSNVVGGLQLEIQSIVRRVLDGRAVRFESGTVSTDFSARAKEMEILLELGLSPVRGLLLYGPPGCGKTVLAREISRLLTERPPKIVSAPELLDRWIGSSEKLVRQLFHDAEQELAACNGDITKSGLHVVVIDEIDAVFRKRSSNTDAGEVVRASVVNQILSKLDGVTALGNVLVIGTTNRKELLDEALLRPGRLEVHQEVPLPDQNGRREILRIHFDALRRKGRLSKPLCEAIDGGVQQSSDDGDESANRGRLAFLPSLSSARYRHRKLKDLAADRWTNGFSGADLAGLVRCAGSLALSRARRDGSGFDGLMITVEDVLKAIEEVKN